MIYVYSEIHSSNDICCIAFLMFIVIKLRTISLPSIYSQIITDWLMKNGSLANSISGHNVKKKKMATDSYLNQENKTLCIITYSLVYKGNDFLSCYHWGKRRVTLFLRHGIIISYLSIYLSHSQCEYAFHLAFYNRKWRWQHGQVLFYRETIPLHTWAY